MTFAIFLETLLSWLTLLGQIGALAIVLLLAFNKKENVIIRTIQKHGMLFAFIVAGIAMAGSLSYSDILMYEPCKLCWYQRIFMYPEVFILGVAMWKRDREASLYALVLAIIGLPIAIYHYLIQRGVLEAGCSVVGSYSVSCAKYFHMSLGYITIPMRAATAFVLIILSMLVYRGDRV